MGQAIGEILPLAIASRSARCRSSPRLKLGTPRARSNGLAFAVGWLAGLTIVGGALLALEWQLQDDGGQTRGSASQLVPGAVPAPAVDGRAA